MVLEEWAPCILFPEQFALNLLVFAFHKKAKLGMVFFPNSFFHRGNNFLFQHIEYKTR
jgi:hypothetical protein